MSGHMIRAVVGVCCILYAYAAGSEVTVTTATVAALADASSNVQLELVELQELVTIAGGPRQHVFTNMNPNWGGLVSAGGSLEWTACGGQFRSEWGAAFDAAAYPAAQDLLSSTRSHVQCGVASASYCAPSVGSAFSAAVGRAMGTLSALTSSELEWSASTAQHQRPAGLAELSASGEQCRMLLAAESTLCTQHMVAILARGSGESILDDVSITYPELLATPWHQLTVLARNNRTHLMVTKRLRFVATGKLATWARRHVPENVDSSLMTQRQLSAVASEEWSIRWSSETVLDGEGVIRVVIAPPRSLAGAAVDTSVLTVQLGLIFPTTQLRPLLHKLHNAKGLRVLTMVHDSELATLSVVLELSADAYGDVNGDVQAVIAIPFVLVFGALSERPPDAHKRYILPQPILQVAVSPCSSEAVEQRPGWSRMFQQASGGCYKYYRVAAQDIVHVALPVPDSAMVFNAVSIALLPFSVLVGTILRRTGRDV